MLQLEHDLAGGGNSTVQLLVMCRYRDRLGTHRAPVQLNVVCLNLWVVQQAFLAGNVMGILERR